MKKRMVFLLLVFAVWRVPCETTGGTTADGIKYIIYDNSVPASRQSVLELGNLGSVTEIDRKAVNWRNCIVYIPAGHHDFYCDILIEGKTYSSRYFSLDFLPGHRYCFVRGERTANTISVNVEDVTTAGEMARFLQNPDIATDGRIESDQRPSAAQAEDYTVSVSGRGTSYSITITQYNGNEKDITIPLSINGIPVSTIGEGAFSGKGLTSVTLPGSPIVRNSAFAENPITRIVITGRPTLTSDCFPGQFTLFYLTMGQRPGLYTLRAGKWAYSEN